MLLQRAHGYRCGRSPPNWNAMAMFTAKGNRYSATAIQSMLKSG
jgi:hypothetical protein